MRFVFVPRSFFALLILVLSSFAVGIAAATTGQFEKVLIDNNLPNVGIYSITQDQNGYLWLASTNTGLMQYDGYQFQQHPLLNNKLTKLKSVPDIDAIVFDRHNNLWAGTWGYGLAMIAADTGNIELFDGKDDLLANPFVQTLFKDKQQRVWIGTTDGINRYDDSTGLTRVDRSEDALPNRRIWAFAQTADNTLWLATSNGLLSWRDDTGFGPVLYPHGADSPDNENRALHVINNELWLGSRAGLFVYQADVGRFLPVTLPTNERIPTINTLATSVNGHLLVGTFNGIFTVDTKQRQFLRQADQQWAELEHVNVRTFFIDQSQVTWVGSRENGLLFKTRQRSVFQAPANPALSELQRTLKAPVLTLLAEPNQLWLGQYGNVIAFSHQNGQSQQYSVPGRVNVITRAPDGSLWCGSDNGIFLFDATTKQFVRFDAPYTAASLAQRNARDIQFLDNSQMLVNLWQDGILLYNRETGSSQRYLADISRRLVGDAVQAMLITQQHIWLASRLSGVYQLDKASMQVRSWNQHSALLAPDYTGQLTCLAHAADNSLLVCSEQGLLQIWPETGKARLIAKKSNVSGSWLVGAHSDKQQNIWLMSTSGLDLLKSDGSIKHFSTVDGLQSNEMMFSAVAEDQQQLYFGSDAGLELVNPALLLPPLPAMPQAISSISFDQHRVTPLVNLKPVSSLQVPAKVARLAFHFASFDFNQAGRNSYLYQLQGYDNDWQQLSNSNIASYTNLTPGQYQLQMRAGNEQQGFNNQISTLDIEVLPHWWQRRSVQFMFILLSLLLVSYLVKRRIDQVKKVNMMLEQAVNQRTAELQHSLQQQQAAYNELQQLDLLKDQFISTVSHELRTPLTAISGALDLVTSGVLAANPEQQQQLLQIASGNSKRLTLLINDLLDLEKLSASQMAFDIQPFALHAIVQQAVQENSTYGQQRQVSLQYQNPDNPALKALCDKHRLLQVLANLLSNAIKFSPPQGEVSLSLQQQGQTAVISVSDQGPGISDAFKAKVFQRFAQENSGNTREQGGTGLGLALSKELMQAMHGDIWFSTRPGAGTTFYLSLPLAEEA